MSTSVSVREAACEPVSGRDSAPAGLGRPLWGVVAAGGWEVGAVGARSIAESITIVFQEQLRKVDVVEVDGIFKGSFCRARIDSATNSTTSHPSLASLVAP